MYKIYQNVVLEDELPFDYSFPEMNNPFVKEYSTIFSKLDLSDIPRFTITPGKTGYDNHSMIKALIVYANEGYRSIPQLIRELKSKPYFSKYILGFKNSIPHHSTFYRFLKAFDTSIIIKLLTKVTRKIYDKNLFKFIAIDSKPVKANTKENNPKAFKKNLSDKNQKPKRNEEATLSYYSKSNDVNTNKKQVVFFWGYRIHIAVEPENDIPIMFILKENNKKDDDVALELYSKILYAYPELYQSKLSQIADKGYYSKKVFERFHFIFDG